MFPEPVSRSPGGGSAQREHGLWIEGRNHQKELGRGRNTPAFLLRPSALMLAAPTDLTEPQARGQGLWGVWSVSQPPGTGAARRRAKKGLRGLL